MEKHIDVTISDNQTQEQDTQEIGTFGCFYDLESADKFVSNLNKSKSQLKYKVLIKKGQPQIVLVKKPIPKDKSRWSPPPSDDPRWNRMPYDVYFLDSEKPTKSLLFWNADNDVQIYKTVWTDNGILISDSRCVQKMSKIENGLRIGMSGMCEGGSRFIRIPCKLCDDFDFEYLLPEEGIVCFVRLEKIIRP